MNSCLLISPGMKLFGQRIGIDSIADDGLPRGLLCLATFLEKHDVQATILSLDELFLGGFSPADFNESVLDDAIGSHLYQGEVSLIGIGFTYTCQFDIVRLIADCCKKLAPELPIVLGGSHPSFLPARTLTEIENADIIIRGEGEWALLDLFTRIAKGKPLDDVLGITFRKRDGSIVSTPTMPLGDVRELPIPNYNLLSKQLLSSQKTAYLNLTRGCSHNCTFCSESNFWGMKSRHFHMANIVEECRILTKELNFKSIIFGDNTFNLRSRRVLNFFDLLQQTVPEDSLKNSAMQSRIDAVDKIGLQTAFSTGIKRITFGIESTADHVLKIMGKRISKDQIFKACETAKEIGFSVGSFWMVGHPGDSIDSFYETYNSMKMLFDKNGSTALQYFNLSLFLGRLFSKIQRTGELKFFHITGFITTGIPMIHL